MHRIAYIFPLLTAVLLLALFRNYDQWWIYPIMVVVVEFILWLIMRRASKTREYLSGFALNIQHHEPWVERVERTETYTDSRGNTRTRVVVDYRHHPDVWLMQLNTGYTIYLHPNAYNYYRELWATEQIWINPPHHNLVSGGGGQLYHWDEIYENAATHTYKGLYINYVANSSSIFRLDNVSKREAKSLGLIDYPKFDREHLEHNVVLCSPKLPKWVKIADTTQRAFHLINAFNGARSQIHIFILIFDAAQGITTALKQQAYWKGGNKNEFVLCLGVDFSQIDPEKSWEQNPLPQVKWSKAFSWCDAPRLESATESWFIEHKEFRLVDYAAWLRKNIGLWRRKEFADFKYLGVTLSAGRRAVVAVTTTLFCIVMIVIICAVAVDNRRNDYHQDDRDYSGYGYTLLDRYILKN